MNITQDMLLHAAVGAAAALAIARYMGYLRTTTPSATPPGGSFAPQWPPPPPVPIQHPTYEAVVNIPHKLAITPQIEVK